MALIERLEKTTDATHWCGQIPMNYVYTAGRAGELFFKTLKEKGEFVGARCNDCGIVYLPPRIHCERCFSNIEGNNVKVPNKGTVHTFTVCHENYEEKAKEAPSIVAMIRMEGAAGGLVHWIRKCEPEECTIGMEVKAVLKPEKNREGSILDIDYFEPIKK
ncbi:MAG: Zn-ribbon domain-containing OB-fold protein [Planctomycetota bacterium]|nr:MAG: Zn-ribbon domain-containing OB-fold protein [Planctomycetota bacterium]